jgi:ABC-2 type transport system ATP-binding protein
MTTDFPLQVCNLTKRFGALLAVDDLSFNVSRGEIFGFLGPNGAGKTTSINMMVGLLDPTSGNVFIEGQPILERRKCVQRLIGVCPQENILWDKLTCLEQLEFIGVNYGMPRRQARTRSAELLEALGLAAKAKELAGRLSGGMKRRLTLATALIHDPQIVFLDEPEAGLDPQSKVFVREMIRLLARRKTVVLTTHNMDEAERLADRVAVIDRGRLLVVDTPDTLKRQYGGGSMLEIKLDAPPPAEEPALQAALDCLKPFFADTAAVNGLLTVRGVDLAARLPEVLQIIQAGGLQIERIQMRTSTLEDVFLSLTGKALRE